MGERRAGDKGSAASGPARVAQARCGACGGRALLKGQRRRRARAAPPRPPTCAGHGTGHGTGAVPAWASPPRPLSTGARPAPACAEPLSSRCPPAPCPLLAASRRSLAVQTPFPSLPRCGGRTRLGPARQKGPAAVPCPWERGRVLPRAGFVSPPRNKSSRFPPPHRGRCCAPVPTRPPGTGPPGTGPPGGSQPLRCPLSRPPAPGRAPGLSPAQPRPPVCPRAGNPQVPGAGSGGRAPPVAERPRAGAAPLRWRARVPRAGGTSPVGRRARGARVEAGRGSEAGWALSRPGKGTPGGERERGPGTGGGSRGKAALGTGGAGPGGPSWGRRRVPGPRGSPARPRCHSPPRGDAPASGRRWRRPGSAGWVPPRAGRGRGGAAGPDPPGRQRGRGRERRQREG